MFGTDALNPRGNILHDRTDRHGDAAVPAGLASGLAAGTRVATTIGWRNVEGVISGDKVLTFDAGLQTVGKVTRGVLWSDPGACPAHLWPLMVPAGALGNQGPMTLLPEQSVMVESDTAEELFGDPFALMPASVLDGVRGIERVRPSTQISVTTLHFAEDQVVFGNIGALFFCPAAGDGDVISDFGAGAEDTPYRPLSAARAETLLALMAMDGHRAV